MINLEIAVAILLAYLLGSISSAILVCKLMRLPDPRTQGSQNPGATNVLRIGGKIPAAITLFGDVLKGIIPVLLAKWYGFSPAVQTLVACAAFIGHLFPIFFRFQGGKGVATLLGCLLALSWLTAIAWMLTWLMVAKISRYSSLAALIASALTPFYIWFFSREISYVAGVIFMVIILIYRHKSNIIKLIQGKESKLTAKEKN